MLLMRFISTLILLLVFVASAYSQTKPVKTNFYLTSGFAQVEEEANFGLLFNGPGFTAGISAIAPFGNRWLSYRFEFSGNVLFSKGIPAIGAIVRPVYLSYLFPVNIPQGKLFAGPSLKAEYRYFLYPDLQAGFDYWFTDISLGIDARYLHAFQKSALQVELNAAMAGLVSRQPAYRDPYFYDIGFDHAVRHLHNQMRIASLSEYFSGSLEVIWQPDKNSGFGLGYVLDYAGYRKAPEFRSVSHNIKLVFRNI